MNFEEKLTAYGFNGIEKGRHPCVNLKPFDLVVGDYVKGIDPHLEGGHTTYIVTAIYPHVFSVVTTDGKFVRTFQKKDYQLGTIRKVD